MGIVFKPSKTTKEEPCDKPDKDAFEVDVPEGEDAIVYKYKLICSMFSSRYASKPKKPNYGKYHEGGYGIKKSYKSCDMFNFMGEIDPLTSDIAYDAYISSVCEKINMYGYL